ncbi:hypothetical protein Tco_0402070 [Tanacetum coccineum]
MNLHVSQEIHGGEQLDSDVDSVIDDHDNTIPDHQYQLNNEVESVPTDVSSIIPGGISVITILDDLRTIHKSALGHRNPLDLKSSSAVLDKEYDQCVIDKKSLEIENKNLLIQNECLLAESVSKDICYVVLTSDIVVPMSVEPRSNCIEEHSRNIELEAEILKVKQLLVEKEKRCSFIETKYQELELKFKKYKECFENPQVLHALRVCFFRERLQQLCFLCEGEQKLILAIVFA